MTAEEDAATAKKKRRGHKQWQRTTTKKENGAANLMKCQTVDNAQRHARRRRMQKMIDD
jgi:hypothetical protein